MFALTLPDCVVSLVRWSLIITTAYFGFNLTHFSLGFLTLTITSFFVLKKQSQVRRPLIKFTIADKLENPFKKAKKAEFSELSPAVIENVKNQLAHFFISDYSYSEVAQAFHQISDKSDCIFARRAKVWAPSSKWIDSISVESNVNMLIVPSFIVFCNVCTDMKLDGYVIQLPGSKYGQNVDDFARVFCEILDILSDQDPSGKHCMRSNVDRSGCVFEFARMTFFITTFAPFYTRTNSRYGHEAEDCFILFQPEVSFANHDLASDTSHTEWDKPVTARDKIRVAFRNANRAYLIRDTVRYPMAHDMIKPMKDGDPLVKWWLYSSKNKTTSS